MDITRLGVPNSTVAEWRAGKKEPKKYHRDALEFWIEAKAGEKVEVPRHPEGEAGKCSQLLRNAKVAVPEHPKGESRK